MTYWVVSSSLPETAIGIVPEGGRCDNHPGGVDGRVARTALEALRDSISPDVRVGFDFLSQLRHLLQSLSQLTFLPRTGGGISLAFAQPRHTAFQSTTYSLMQLWKQEFRM